MTVLLRTIAIWTGLQGLVVILFGLSHWRIAWPPQGGVLVSALLLVFMLVFAGLLAMWAGVELWSLKRRGRVAAAAFYVLGGAVCVAGMVSSGRITPFLIPLLLAGGIVGLLLSQRSARRTNVDKAMAVMVLVLAAHVVMGCSDNRAWTQLDPWYRPPPSLWSGDVSTLDSRHVIVVPDEKRVNAQAILATTSAMLLSPAEVSNLAGVEVTPDPGMRVYLVRAVYLNEATGGFDVRQAGTELTCIT